MPFESSESQKAAIQKLKQRLSGYETEEGRLGGLSFKPDSTDVFITTTPKAGTTWVQQICHQLRTNGDMEFEEVSGVVPWIELAGDIGQDLNAPQKALPRCFKTHCWYDHCPKGGKYIVVVRNPMDVAVSFYRFFEGWFFEPGEIELEDFVREFWLARGIPENKMQNASMFHHYLSWWEHRNDENVLWLHFEDLKEDLPSCVNKIAKFIGIDSKDSIKTAIDHSSFAFMKKHEKQFNDSLSKLGRNQACGLPKEAGLSGSKVRDGNVGGSKLALSNDLQIAIQDKWNEVITPVTGYKTYEDARAKINEEGKLVSS